jgi:predicted small integral membrane protein
MKGLGRRLTLFFILTKITMQMAMRINVTTTPTSTPRTGVICTSTARDDAANVLFYFFQRKYKK